LPQSLAREALDDGAVLRVMRDEFFAFRHFEVGEVEARGNRAAYERVGIWKEK
jgi:hypothetical protein